METGPASAKLRPLLDERQRRALAGLTARALGRAGVTQVASAFGMSRKTVTAAVAEIDAGLEPQGRVRRSGGGRKKLMDHDPDLRVAHDALVDPDSRGDPMCRLCWTITSTRNLADELSAQGHPASSWTVAQLLRYMVSSCCTTWATACSPTPRPKKGRSIPTGTASSVGSTPR